jgi:hypothetical protein
VIVALTVCAVVPAPMAWLSVAVDETNVESVPHSNHAFVACAFGFTVPLSAALSVPIPVAGVVVTVGEGGGPEELPPPPHPVSATARSNIGIHNRELRYGLIFYLLCFFPARSSGLEPVGRKYPPKKPQLFLIERMKQKQEQNQFAGQESKSDSEVPKSHSRLSIPFKLPVGGVVRGCPPPPRTVP